jgi:hypothetical protein
MCLQVVHIYRSNLDDGYHAEICEGSLVIIINEQTCLLHISN